MLPGDVEKLIFKTFKMHTTLHDQAIQRGVNLPIGR